MTEPYALRFQYPSFLFLVANRIPMCVLFNKVDFLCTNVKILSQLSLPERIERKVCHRLFQRGTSNKNAEFKIWKRGIHFIPRISENKQTIYVEHFTLELNVFDSSTLPSSKCQNYMFTLQLKNYTPTNINNYKETIL